MKRVEVLPELIDPNPYQPDTRIAFEPADLADLASVREGFIHTPVGRAHPTQPGYYQIAVGWRRRCAWALYRPGEPMPLDVCDLDDLAMFINMVRENGDRMNNSAVEKARLIQQYIDFGHTQAEAGTVFHLTQSGVSNLLRLVRGLPEPIVNLVHQGKLPERHARQLIGLARTQKSVAIEIAEHVAESADPDAALSEAIEEFVDKLGADLSENADFQPDWAPDMSVDIEGVSEVPPACAACPSFMRHDHDLLCARPACMAAKQELFCKIELERVARETGLPIAQPDEKIKPLKISWNTNKIVENWLKGKKTPECLRLSTTSAIKCAASDHDFYHQKAVGSDVVVLCSTDPNVLNRELAARDKANTPKIEPKKPEKKKAETPEQKQKRIAAEEAEKESNREERSALRRTKADILWLVRNTAELCEPQMVISGGVLGFCFERSQHQGLMSSSDWPDMNTLMSDFREGARSNNPATAAMWMRRYILAFQMWREIGFYRPEEQYSWTRATGKVKGVIEDTFKLRLIGGWDQPPIHSTETNCHVCGKFTPGPTITGVDKAHGWMSIDGVVTCSTACRAELAKDKPARKSPPTKKKK